MKKYLLLILIFLGSNSFAQTIQNGGFETWNNLLLFYEPQGYVTSNYASLLLGGGLPRANVSRSTVKYSGTYSAKLESYARNNGDTTGVPGIMITGELDLNNVSIKPGIPISGGRPSELKGYYKYAEGNMPDSGLVTVALTKYNPLAGGLNIVGAGIAILPNKSEFTSFSVPIFYMSNDTPDTAIIVISTTFVSGLDTSTLTSAPVGSILYVDELSFFGSATGIQSIESLIEASLYPNPSSDRMTVSYYQKNDASINLQLMSTDGRVVYSLKEYRSSGYQKLSLDVSTLDAGIYILSIDTKDGKICKKIAITE